MAPFQCAGRSGLSQHKEASNTHAVAASELVADWCDEQSVALMQVLPAVYLFIGKALHATPAQLGTLTLCRALVQVGLCGHVCLM